MNTDEKHNEKPIPDEPIPISLPIDGLTEEQLESMSDYEIMTRALDRCADAKDELGTAADLLAVVGSPVEKDLAAAYEAVIDAHDRLAHELNKFFDPETTE